MREVLETDTSDWLAFPRMFLGPSSTEAPTGLPFRLLVYTDLNPSGTVNSG